MAEDRGRSHCFHAKVQGASKGKIRAWSGEVLLNLANTRGKSGSLDWNKEPVGITPGPLKRERKKPRTQHILSTQILCSERA